LGQGALTTAEWDREKVEKKIFKGYKQPGASLPRGVPAIVNGVAVSAVGSEQLERGR
jgi:hypothetical protein